MPSDSSVSSSSASDDDLEVGARRPPASGMPTASCGLARRGRSACGPAWPSTHRARAATSGSASSPNSSGAGRTSRSPSTSTGLGAGRRLRASSSSVAGRSASSAPAASCGWTLRGVAVRLRRGVDLALVEQVLAGEAVAWRRPGAPTAAAAPRAKASVMRARRPSRRREAGAAAGAAHRRVVATCGVRPGACSRGPAR